jgi:hypothetical protein
VQFSLETAYGLAGHWQQQYSRPLVSAITGSAAHLKHKRIMQLTQSRNRGALLGHASLRTYRVVTSKVQTRKVRACHLLVLLLESRHQSKSPFVTAGQHDMLTCCSSACCLAVRQQSTLASSKQHYCALGHAA